MIAKFRKRHFITWVIIAVVLTFLVILAYDGSILLMNLKNNFE